MIGDLSIVVRFCRAELERHHDQKGQGAWCSVTALSDFKVRRVARSGLQYFSPLLLLSGLRHRSEASPLIGRKASNSRYQMQIFSVIRGRMS